MYESSSSEIPLQDTNQSFWQLAVIQLTGVTSLPVLTASVLIIQNNSLLNAIVTLLIGNIILWIIRYGIILMSHKNRKSTIDITREYVGKFGMFFIAILLLIDTLVWFIAQTTLASNSLNFLIQINEGSNINRFIQTSALIGILSTLLCMEGIVVLRWLSVISFPILIVVFTIIIFTIPLQTFPEFTGLSFSGLGIVIGTSLGVTADLPTFFRHSKSLKTSMIALTVIQLLSLAIGIGGLFLGSVINPWLGINQAIGLIFQNDLLKISFILLIFISVINANVANVYSASVAWELVAPTVLVERKEYLILGLGLTTIFMLVANTFSLAFLLNPADSSLVDLCLVLFFGYIIQLIKKRVPNTFEHLTYFLAWLIATIINCLQQSSNFLPNFSPLIVGTALISTTIIILSLIEMLLNLNSKNWQS